MEKEKIKNEVLGKVGKNRDITLSYKIVKRKNDEGYEEKAVVLFFKEKNVEKELADDLSSNNFCTLLYNKQLNSYALVFYLGINKIFVQISSEIYTKLQNLLDKVKKENKEAYFSIQLTFQVQEIQYTLVDTSLRYNILKQSRERLTNEEDKRLTKIYAAIQNNKDEKIRKMFDDITKSILPDSRFERSKTYTLDDLEKLFEKELKEYEEHLKQQQEDYEQKKQKALVEAKRTGKEIIIQRIGAYCGNEGKEEGMVVVYEVATPDGRVIEKAYPTY